MSAISPNENPLVLVTVSGKDSPGITAAMTQILAESEATILDIGQAVIHDYLSLSILFELPTTEAQNKATIKDLLFRASEMGLKLNFQVIEKDKNPLAHPPHSTYALTLISDQITAKGLFQVTNCLAKNELNIEIIQRLSDQEFSCVEVLVSAKKQLNTIQLKKELFQIAQQAKVDVALQTDGIFRKAKRLIVMDMDSTLIQNEVIDEFAREVEKYSEVSKITEEAMKGNMNFDESLKLRCQYLKGLTEAQINSVFERIVMTPGAEEIIKVLKQLGYKVGLISGGFQFIAKRLKDKLNIDFAYANTLEMQDGVCTGIVTPPIVNAQRKSDLLELLAQQENIGLDQVIAIGDGANDILMLEKAGLGIAFNAKPQVRAKADLALNQKNLRSVLYLLGIRETQIKSLS